MSKKIAVVGNSGLMSKMLSDVLRWSGYKVGEVEIGDAGEDREGDREGDTLGDKVIDYLRGFKPDMVVVDTDKGGLDICQRMADENYIDMAPLILVSSNSSDDLRLKGLELGADSVLVRPIKPKELLTRVSNLIKMIDRNRGANPLTGLQGNMTIAEEVNDRISSGNKFAVLYCDLDNFKVYNDVYGFASGDKVIQLTADVITNAIREEGTGRDFVGHIGGDDFVAITDVDYMEEVCKNIIDNFDRRVLTYYNERDAKNGFVGSKEYGVVSISIAVVTNENKEISSNIQLGEIAAHVKKKAKSIKGSVYFVDRRK